MAQLYHRISRLQSRPVMIPSGVVPSVSGSDIVVDWNAVPTADSYNYYASIDGGAWTLLGNSATTSYTFTPTVPGEYNFRVTSVRGTQESAPSAETLYDEMMEQVYSDTITGLRISAVDGTAFVDGDIANEAPTDCCTDPDNDVDVTTGWFAANSAVLDSVPGGDTGNCLEIKEGGSNNPYAIVVVATNPGEVFNFTGKAKAGTEATYAANVIDKTNSIAVWSSGDAEASADWTNTWDATLTAPAGCFELQFMLYQITSSGAGTTVFFDDVVIKRVTLPLYADGNHLLEIEDSLGNVASGVMSEQGSGETLGSELVVNGTFDSDLSGWLATNWLWDVGKAQAVVGNTNSLVQNILTLGVLYKGSVDVTGVTAGTLRFRTGNSYTAGYITSDGSYEYYGICVGNTQLLLSRDTLFDGAVDNISAKQVTAPSTSGALIVSEIDGATQNFVSIPAGFTFNESSYICRVKKILPTA